MRLPALLLIAPAIVAGLGPAERSWERVRTLQEGVSLELMVQPGAATGPDARAWLRGRFVRASSGDLTFVLAHPDIERISEGPGGVAAVDLSDGRRLEVIGVEAGGRSRVLKIRREQVVELRSDTGAHHGGRGAWMGALAVVAIFTAIDFATDPGSEAHGLGVMSGIYVAPGGALVGYLWGRQFRRTEVVYRKYPAEESEPGEGGPSEAGLLEEVVANVCRASRLSALCR